MSHRAWCSSSPRAERRALSWLPDSGPALWPYNAIELNGADAEYSGRQIVLESGVPRRALASSINTRLIIAPSSNHDLSANRARTSTCRVLVFATDVEIDHIEAVTGED